MAEGGEFDYDAELDDISNVVVYDDDDDDKSVSVPSEEEQEVDTTKPFFVPDAASTSYHGGEQHEMQTMQHEQSGLPVTSYEETPLLGAQAQAQRSWDALTKFFPDASSIDLEATYSKTGRLQVKMAGFGKKGL